MDQLDLIANMDETPICYENIYSTTITTFGTQIVSVINFNKDKLHITVILCIISDRTKLPPLIIFKGETNKTKEKKLQNNEYLKKCFCFVKCQPNSWADNNLFIYWLNNIWFNNSILNRRIKNTLLIIDRATTHFCNYLNSLFKKYDSHYLLIPRRLTRYLQPLDVAINKSFKQAMKKSDCEFRINYENKICPNDDEIIKHVVLN